MSADAVWLVTGIPGAGKTTVARLLAARCPRGAHVESDAVQELIVSGGVLPGEDPAEESERQLRLRTRNVSLLADSLFDAGFTPVVDDVLAGGRLGHYLDELQSRPVLLAVLAPPVGVALARDAGRQKQVAALWAHLDADLRTALAGRGLWVDSGALTAEATVELLLAGRAHARVA